MTTWNKVIATYIALILGGALVALAWIYADADSGTMCGASARLVGCQRTGETTSREGEVMSTTMAFIVGAMMGNLFGMFLMGLLVASRDRDDAHRAYREYRVDKQSANE